MSLPPVPKLPKPVFALVVAGLAPKAPKVFVPNALLCCCCCCVLEVLNPPKRDGAEVVAAVAPKPPKPPNPVLVPPIELVGTAVPKPNDEVDAAGVVPNPPPVFVPKPKLVPDVPKVLAVDAAAGVANAPKLGACCCCC